MGVQNEKVAPMLCRNIEMEIEQLSQAHLAEVKEQWEAAFGAPPPKGISRKLMVRVLAHDLQVRAFGRLKPRFAKQLLREERVAVQPGKKIATPALAPGTRLVREWHGVCHHVDVIEDGFRWENKSYTSLSAIAGAMTGTRWNGPLFFGLRKKGEGGS